MFQAINTKILLVILAALVTIGGLVYRHNVIAEREAEAAAKTAALLAQQQKEAAEQKRKYDEDMRKADEARGKSKAFNDGGTKTWQHYIP